MVFLRSNQSWASHLGGHERLVGLGRIILRIVRHPGLHHFGLGAICDMALALATPLLTGLAFLTTRFASLSFCWLLFGPVFCTAFSRVFSSFWTSTSAVAGIARIGEQGLGVFVLPLIALLFV